MIIEFILYVVLGLLIVSLPFQILAVLAYFFARNLLPSRRALLTVLTPAIAFCIALIIMVVNSSQSDAAGRVWAQLETIVCFIVGPIINVAFSSIILKLLTRKKRKFTNI
jgi:hypothetical protein